MMTKMVCYLIAVLLIPLGVRAAPSCPVEHPAIRAAARNKLYLYFPTADDAGFPAQTNCTLGTANCFGGIAVRPLQLAALQAAELQERNQRLLAADYERRQTGRQDGASLRAALLKASAAREAAWKVFGTCEERQSPRSGSTPSRMSGAALIMVVGGVASAAAAQEPPTRTYIARSRGACEAIDYTCPAGAKSFQDDTGCGCETARAPPSVPRP